MDKDPREVKYSAKEHTDLVNTILAETKLKPYNIFRHIDIAGRRFVDIGCGDGAISRLAADYGAEYILGIDGKPEMIQIANKLNPFYVETIDYKLGFIEDLNGRESFDVAILSYLLNNAKSFDQLLKQCEKTASYLKPGGTVVVYNSNPFDIKGGDFTKYGFRKIITGTNEGDKIIYDYRPAIDEDIINYYISPKRHEEAFTKAGFRDFKWEPLELYPGADKDFWKDYFDREHLPVIGITARKA
ncbi:MAG TPA: class I SAM-dependent methyltransferase [Alphaproteobacteria bacterium]|nr:class I SAM-dependent methyltransferase [Alphaproteobacteria bacterium]